MADGEQPIAHRRSGGGIALRAPAAPEHAPPSIVSMVAAGKSLEHMAKEYSITVEQMRAMITARPDVEELYQKIYEEPAPAPRAATLPTPPSTPPPESPTTENTETPPVAPPAAPAAPVVAGGARRRAVRAPGAGSSTDEQATPTRTVAGSTPAQPADAQSPPSRPQEGLVGLVPPAVERRLIAVPASKLPLIPAVEAARYMALGRLYEAAQRVGVSVEDLVALVAEAFPK